MPDEPDDLDGCEVDMTDPAHLTGDNDIDVVVMFADCWDDPDAVERRRAELVEWTAATDGP